MKKLDRAHEYARLYEELFDKFIEENMSDFLLSPSDKLRFRSKLARLGKDVLCVDLKGKRKRHVEHDFTLE